jgi:nucleotide-binding universal stress UspA family protein
MRFSERAVLAVGNLTCSVRVDPPRLLSRACRAPGYERGSTVRYTRTAGHPPTIDGVSGGRRRHVLAMLDRNPVTSRHVLERAVELAETRRARLTVAKPTRPDLFSRACAHVGATAELCSFLFASGDSHMSEIELEAAAATELALIAEHLSCSVPLSTLVLRGSAATAVRRVAMTRSYDAVILPARVVRRRGWLRSAFRGVHLEVMCAEGTVLPCPTSGFSGADAPSAVSSTPV